MSMPRFVTNPGNKSSSAGAVDLSKLAGSKQVHAGAIFMAGMVFREAYSQVPLDQIAQPQQIRDSLMLMYGTSPDVFPKVVQHYMAQLLAISLDDIEQYPVVAPEWNAIYVRALAKKADADAAPAVPLTP